MRTRTAILATVVSAGLAGSTAGFAAHRASDPFPPSIASTSVGIATPTTSAAVATTVAARPSRLPTTTAEPVTPTTDAKPTPSSTPTTPSPTPTTQATAAPAAPSKPVHSPEWDVSSLLTTAELAKAGLPAQPSRSPSRSAGTGQAAMGDCEPDLPVQEGARAFFRADTSFDYLKDKGGFESQMTARFPTSSLARQAVERIVAQRTDCAAPWGGPEGPWTSSPVHRSTVAGASVVTWTTTPPNGVGFETLVVVRSASFVSVILVHGTDSWRGHVSTSSLAASSAARLP